jgi:hypothetical protein
MKRPYLIIAILTTAIQSPTLQAQTSYSTIVSNDAPVLYWNFDEASGNAREIIPVILPPTVNDLAPVATATRVSHASLSDGLNLGNAASFFVGDYFIANNLAVPTNALRGAWMLEFWMRVQGSQEFQRNNYLMNFGGGPGNSPSVLYDYVGGAQPREGLEIFGGGGRSGVGPIIDNQEWHHLVFAYYGNGTNGVADQLDVYLDGTNAAQNVRATFFSSANAAMALTRFVVGTSSPQFAGSDGFEGNLDEIAIYDLSTLSNSIQVTSKASLVASNHFSLAHSAQSYTAGVLADSPLLYWNFDEADGNAQQLAPVTWPPVHDDLTPNGGAVRLSHASSHSGLALGNAAHFPVGGFFNIGQIIFPTNSIPAPWLIEFWMQAEGSQATQRNDYLANFGNNAPSVLYDYIGGAQPRDGLEMFRGGRSGAGAVVADSKWHHVLMAYYGDGSTGVADRFDVYLDGTNAAQNIRATFVSDLTLSSLSIGSSGAQFASGDGFEGNLDEFALYDLTGLTSEADVTTKAADIAARHFAAAQQPSLAASVANGQLTISWNSSATGFALESATNLTAPTWSTVNIAPTLTNDQSQVIIPVTNQFRFFRLRK